jgi:hypothetical protein
MKLSYVQCKKTKTTRKVNLNISCHNSNIVGGWEGAQAHPHLGPPCSRREIWNRLTHKILVDAY